MTCPVFFRNTLITLEPDLVTHFDLLRALVKGWGWDFTWELSPGFSTAEGGSLSVVAASPWKPLRAAPPPHWSGPRSRDHGSGMITLTGWIFKGPPRWMRVRAQAQSTESCGAVMLQQWAALHDMRGHWRQGPSDDPKLKIGPSLSIWRLWGPTKTAQKAHPSAPMWELPKCFGNTHTRWWYSGGARYTTNAIFLPLPQTYIWRRRPFYLLRCFQRALTLGRVQSTNQCAKQPHPSLTSDFSPMLFKTCYLQKQECVLKACFTWFVHSVEFHAIAAMFREKEKEQFFFQYFHGFTE